MSVSASAAASASRRLMVRGAGVATRCSWIRLTALSAGWLIGGYVGKYCVSDKNDNRVRALPICLKGVRELFLNPLQRTFRSRRGSCFCDEGFRACVSCDARVFGEQRNLI